MAERKKRFSGLYWQQFALTAGMVMLTLLLLGVSFFALSYNYNFTERRDELQERASLIAQVSVDYLKSGGQTEDENLKRFISLGSAMTNAEFLVCAILFHIAGINWNKCRKVLRIGHHTHNDAACEFISN